MGLLFAIGIILLVSVAVSFFISYGKSDYDLKRMDYHDTHIVLAFALLFAMIGGGIACIIAGALRGEGVWLAIGIISLGFVGVSFFKEYREYGYHLYFIYNRDNVAFMLAQALIPAMLAWGIVFIIAGVS